VNAMSPGIQDLCGSGNHFYVVIDGRGASSEMHSIVVH
jgi:hypothetical protein